MNTILQKLEKLNKTMEDGLARVEQMKTSSKPKTNKVLKMIATTLVAAPLAWAGLVLGALVLYGLANSIAWGMSICLKFLGF